jgi:methylthioribose-1-phosphate isomerase
VFSYKMMLTKTLSYQPIEWLSGKVRIIDQTKLPGKEVYLDITDYREMCAAIKELKVRGAPAIGVAGAYGAVLGSRQIKTKDFKAYHAELDKIIQEIWATRPTARNLFFALERMKMAVGQGKTIEAIQDSLLKEAQSIHKYEVEATQRISEYGAVLLKDGWTVLTHCNAGPLATGGMGTALGVILAATAQDKKISVIADETRPLLQGARLTAWELQKAGVPVKLITDNMSGHFMKAGKIDCVITGADRIAANGDTANKIGTYSVAVLAKENKIPFYIAAPVSTIDPSLKTGEQIPIEERKPEEVTHLHGSPIAPAGISALNPAFDVTPHRYITAIITDKGIIRPPYTKSIKDMLKN